MAREIFTGTDLANAANYKTADGLAATGPAASGSTFYIEGGGQDINPSGVDLSATVTTSIKIFSVYNFSGNLGSPTGAVKFNSGSGTTYTGTEPFDRVDYFANKGGFWHEAKGGSTSATCNLLRVGGGGHYYGMGGDFINVDIQGATAEFNSICTFGAAATVENNGGSLTINHHSSDVLPTLNIFGGVTNLKRATTTVNIYSGEVIIDASLGVVTTINLLGSNARCTLVSTLADGSSNPIVTGNFRAGTLDCSRLTRLTQITSATVTKALRIIDSPNLVMPTGSNITIKGRPVGRAV